MKVFTSVHNGLWPVGACSVVVAVDADAARDALRAELAKSHIHDDDLQMVEVDTDKRAVHVLLDGNY